MLIGGKFTYTLSEFLYITVGTVQQWSDRTQLSINPQKMVGIPFTRKRD